MWEFVQGTTFLVAGAFQVDGLAVDMTDWSITAQIHDASGQRLLATLTGQWVNPAEGLLQLRADNTSTWPPGRARIDVAVRDPQGHQYVSQPDYFRVIDTPLLV